MASPGTDDNAKTRLPGKPSWISITKNSANSDKATIVHRLRQRCNLDSAISPRTRKKPALQTVRMTQRNRTPADKLMTKRRKRNK